MTRIIFQAPVIHGLKVVGNLIVDWLPLISIWDWSTMSSACWVIAVPLYLSEKDGMRVTELSSYTSLLSPSPHLHLITLLCLTLYTTFFQLLFHFSFLFILIFFTCFFYLSIIHSTLLYCILLPLSIQSLIFEHFLAGCPIQIASKDFMKIPRT